MIQCHRLKNSRWELVPPQRSNSTRCVFTKRTQKRRNGWGRGCRQDEKPTGVDVWKSIEATWLWSLFDLWIGTWIDGLICDAPSSEFLPPNLIHVKAFSVKLELDSVLPRPLSRKDVWFWMHVRTMHFHHLCSMYVTCFLHLFRSLLLFVVPMSGKMNLYFDMYNVHTGIQHPVSSHWSSTALFIDFPWLLGCLTHDWVEQLWNCLSNVDLLYIPILIYNPEMNMTHENGETVILLMEEIPNNLGCTQPSKWEKLPTSTA